ncbi:hypothetical protein ANTRET_LOCUS9688 [Anthophora retusa]
MVKFIYREEATVPHQLLSPLLAVPKTFKVKEIPTMDSKMNPEARSFETIASPCVKPTESNVTANEAIEINCTREQASDECFTLSKNSNSVAGSSGNESSEHKPPEEELEQDSPRLQNKNAMLIDDAERMAIRCSQNGDTSCTNSESKPTLYEQCCDLSDTEESDESSTLLSQSCLQQIEKDFARYKFEGVDVPNKPRKCVKVYTHKRRRKSIDEIKNKLTDVNTIVQSPPSTDCIDLLEEPSANDIPVTLLTSLDMESAEYIISLSTENIQSIVGATLTRGKDEIAAKEDHTKPALRRSSRLNQQELEDPASFNSHGKERRKSSSPNGGEICTKRKRKIKDAERNMNAKRALNSRKIAKRGKEIDSAFALPKLDTIEHINRALWGDMSDCESKNLLECAPNTEIPFAVGLLPLRTALEKMQATPDYQPRKTRSSVAPLRHDYGFKGKNDLKENAKAVCHIQIRTAPSQFARNRKKYLAANVDVQSPIIVNKHR